MENKKIPLYEVRQFGEKISDTFAFVSENFKPLLKYVTYFMLPVALLAGLALNHYMEGVANAASGMSLGAEISMLTSMSGMMVVSLIVALLMPTIVFGLMRVYGDREHRLRNLTWAEFKPVFTHLLGRNAKLILAFFVLSAMAVAFFGALVALIVSVAAIGGGDAAAIFFTLLLMVAFIALILPLALVEPIYLFEDGIGIIAAFKKAFRLGSRTWGGIFGVALVLGLVVSIVSGLISLPWGIMIGAKTALGMSGDADSFVESTSFSFLAYLLGVVQAYVGYLCYTVMHIGMAYQYGHAAEKIDHVTVEADIEQFETLGTD